VGGARPAVNAYFHYFPFLLDVVPPPLSSSSPTSRAASLHRRAPLRPVAIEVRTPVSPTCGRHGHQAKAERPPLRAAAGDAGHRARLGRVFLKVSPPSPTRARRLPSLAPLAVGSRPALVAVAPCRCVRVRACVCASHDALAQACTPARAHRNPGGEAGPLALLLRRTSSSPTSPPARAMASP
jgi:hypothetical protein